MSYPYSTPTGGTRAPSPKPGPTPGPVPMHSWRQPAGGVRIDPTAPTR
jgi:hypothetical protein